MQRVLSGIQPSGKVHIGNYLGAISKWVELQQTYEPFYFIADLHALTTSYEAGAYINRESINVARALLACGIDPEKSSLFVQSAIPEHCELHLIFSMITPLPWLERLPTYKSKKLELKERDLNTYGFLGYPVLQAADIVLYYSDLVPVGKDQLPHLEITREIVRRFNHLYHTDYFKEPKELLTDYPVLPGTDGRKMSKSYGNTIDLEDEAEQILAKVKMMVTDPQRIKKSDKGNPEICSVFAYHKLFSIKTEIDQIDHDCRSAEIGCVECKKLLAAKLENIISPIREKIRQLSDHQVLTILEEGNNKAGKIARENIKKVKEIIKI